MENKNNTNKDFKTDTHKTDKNYQGSANQHHKQSDGSLKPGQVQQNTAPNTSATGGQDNQSTGTYQQPSSGCCNDKNSQNRASSPYSANQPNNPSQQNHNQNKPGTSFDKTSYNTTSNPGQQKPGRVEDPYKKPAVDNPQTSYTPGRYETDKNAGSKYRQPEVGKRPTYAPTEDGEGEQNISAKQLDNSGESEYENGKEVSSSEFGSNKNSASKDYGQSANPKTSPKANEGNQNHHKQKPSPVESYETSDKNRNQGLGRDNPRNIRK